MRQARRAQGSCYFPALGRPTIIRLYGKDAELAGGVRTREAQRLVRLAKVGPRSGESGEERDAARRGPEPGLGLGLGLGLGFGLGFGSGSGSEGQGQGQRFSV